MHSKDFFNKIDLSKLDTITATQIREEILTLSDSDWDLIDNDTEMQKQMEIIKERLENDFPDSLGMSATIDTGSVAEVVNKAEDEISSLKEAIEYLQAEADAGDEESREALEYLREELKSLTGETFEDSGSNIKNESKDIDYLKYVRSKTDEYRKEGYTLMDAIATAFRDLGLETNGKFEKKKFDKVINTNANVKKAWNTYKKESEIYVKDGYYMNPYQLYANGGGVGDMGEKILTYKLKDNDFQVKIRYNYKHKKWEGLHRAINPKNNQPLQKWGFDKDSLTSDTKENLIQKYMDEYGDDFFANGGGVEKKKIISESGIDKLKKLGIKDTREFGNKYRDFLDRMEEPKDGKYVGYKLDLITDVLLYIQENGMKTISIKDYSEFPKLGTFELLKDSSIYYSTGGQTEVYVAFSLTSDGVLLTEKFDNNIDNKTLYQHYKNKGYEIVDSDIFKVTNYNLKDIYIEAVSNFVMEKYNEDIDWDNSFLTYEIADDMLFVKECSVKTMSGKEYLINPDDLLDNNYARGGSIFGSERPKSAIMRDRAYKSNEPHEKRYKRKSKPKNPRYSKYKHGGNIEGIDLFEDYENIPADVQDILDRYSEDFEDGNYSGMEEALMQLESIGYTFDYDLNGIAYDLRPIGTKGKSEFED
jgi:hypothetical protein